MFTIFGESDDRERICVDVQRWIKHQFGQNQSAFITKYNLAFIPYTKKSLFPTTITLYLFNQHYAKDKSK